MTVRRYGRDGSGRARGALHCSFQASLRSCSPFSSSPFLTDTSFATVVLIDLVAPIWLNLPRLTLSGPDEGSGAPRMCWANLWRCGQVADDLIGARNYNPRFKLPSSRHHDLVRPELDADHSHHSGRILQLVPGRNIFSVVVQRVVLGSAGFMPN